MRYVFIINPAAGQGNLPDELRDGFLKAAEKAHVSADIYETKGVGDAEDFVRHTLGSDPGEKVCFIACGGDGTFNEVLNGCVGNDNAVCSVFPTGTGNDFVRNFPDAGDFGDIEALLEGNVIKCDAIEYSGVIDGEFRTRYCGNMFNIGFDANVVYKTAELKKKPFLSGSMAYLAGVVYTLIKKTGADLKITANDTVLCDGPILLTSIANGSYCGGGVKSNPYANVQDGMIDLSVIQDMGRLKFITLFPKYQKGTHLDTPEAKDLINNVKCEEVTVIPRNGSMRLCTDGEITTAEGVIFRIMPQAFNLLVPAKRA